MSVTLFSPPWSQFEASSGAPLAGALLYFYETGTTTPVTVYQDKDRTTAHANPVVADSTGTFSAIYLPDGMCKAVLKTSAGVTVRTADPVGELTTAPSVTAVPTGAYLPYGGTSAPTGFLLCDGSEVSRSTYSTLFGVIGTAYGSGDGATTFTLPDMRGRAPFGRDNMGGIDAARIPSAITGRTSIGGTGGAATTTLAEANLPAHTHTGTTSSDGAHTHTTAIETDGAGGSGGAGRMKSGGTTATSSNGAHTHTFTTSSVGSGTAATTLSPALFSNWIIKT